MKKFEGSLLPSTRKQELFYIVGTMADPHGADNGANRQRYVLVPSWRGWDLWTSNVAFGLVGCFLGCVIFSNLSG